MVKNLADTGADSSKENSNLPSIMMGISASVGGGRCLGTREHGVIYIWQGLDLSGRWNSAAKVEMVLDLSVGMPNASNPSLDRL